MSRLPRAALLTTLLALAAGGSASAAPVPFVFDGSVQQVVHAADATYVAGTFTHEYAPTGGGIVTSALGSGSPDPAAFSHVVGQVEVAAADGAGGWYVAGDITMVGDLGRTRLAHILPSGLVDPAWAPNPNDEVDAIAVAGGRVYVAGYFSEMNGTWGASFVALDPKTGAVVPGTPDVVSGSVASLVGSGTTLYLGGNFTDVGGQPRHGFAALDASTGALTAWNPAPDAEYADGHVAGVVGRTVYVSGSFDAIGGRVRKGLAAVDAKTGAVRAWNPAPDDASSSLMVAEGKVYAFGPFTRIGGARRAGLARLDAATGRATAWNPAHRGPAELLAGAAGRVYAIGSFGHGRGAPRFRLTQLGAGSGRPTTWAAAPVGAESNSYESQFVPGLVVATSGKRVYVGGDFAAAGRPLDDIAGLARIRADGSLDTSWRPDPTGTACGLAASPTAPHQCVEGIAVAGAAVYIGGAFTRIGGKPRAGIAALDATTGRARSWDPRPTGHAVPRAVAGGAVLVTGAFSAIGGQPRANLAALDPTTAQATAWAPNPDGATTHLVTTGSAAYVGGAFTRIGGQDRHGLVAVDLATGAVTAWSPAGAAEPHVLAADDGAVYVGPPEPHDHALGALVTRVDPATGASVFATMAGDGIEQIAPGGPIVYVASGSGLTAIDAATGARLPWHPQPNYTWSEGDGRTFGQNGLAVAGPEVYAAGGFWHTATDVTGPLARLDGTTGATLPTTMTVPRAGR